MFSTEHFMWLAICTAFIVGLSLISIKKKFSLKCAGRIMTAICIVSETSKILCNMIESPEGGMHLDPAALPFHLCSQMIFAVLYITFGKPGKFKQLLMNFLAVMGTLGSLMALMIPTNGTDFLDIGAYQCFVYHAGLMWFGIYLIGSKQADLGLKSLGRNLVFMIAITVFVLYVNSFLSAYDTNFLYLTRPPMENLPYLNLDRGWYIYFLRLVTIAVVLISAFHLPFIIKERHSN